jgi:DNA-binding transcriptional ArsR family regulator
LARPFSAVYRLVTADYGTCDERTVHRHLRLLRDEGKVVRVEVEPGKHFAIYLRAESKLLHNIDEIREDLHDLIESHRISAGRKKER